jgi:hypothetical protein
MLVHTRCNTIAMKTNRREFLALGASTAILPGSVIAEPGTPPGKSSGTAADLARYTGFGIKASGGPGDTAAGEWIEGELRAAGFDVVRQPFQAPYFDATTAILASGTAVSEVIPQAIVVPGTVTGPLVSVGTPCATQDLDGAVALVELPYQRWSTATAKPVRDTVAAALAAGATGAVIVTSGPTGEALALNAPADRPLFGRPAAILAPNDAKPFRLAAQTRAPATLTLAGRGGMRPAFNLAGKIERGAGSWVVVSTPRSGWFTCAGERGPGIAVWLSLARWAVKGLPAHNLLFTCNSGHEYENLGSAHLIQEIAPRPAETALWLHLGANVAARDWHDFGSRLEPLPSADPQRILVVSPGLLHAARSAFAGLPGLEAPYPSTEGGAGELSNILAAGYPRVAGIFGAHRYHHAKTDDARAVSAPLIGPVTSACRALLAGL